MSKTAVDFRALYELADREFSVGLADGKLLQRAVGDAQDVPVLVRQIYCELRAKELRAQGSGIEELVARVEAQEKRVRARKELNRWLWASTCFAGLVGTVVCSWFALAAVSKGTRFYALALLTFLSFVLTVLSFVASRYHSDAE